MDKVKEWLFSRYENGNPGRLFLSNIINRPRFIRRKPMTRGFLQSVNEVFAELGNDYQVRPLGRSCISQVEKGIVKNAYHFGTL